MKFVLSMIGLVAAVSARPGVLPGYDYTGPNTSPIIDVGPYPPSTQYLPSQPSQTYIPSDTSPPFIPGVPSPNYLPTTGTINQHAQDQRHVYFYAAPEDGEQSRLRIYVNPSGQRNTKIIFVKAPSYGGVVPEIIAPPSQSEDKTKIYVLVKKPGYSRDITIPASATVKQAKPEVFFIKYNNKHDAQVSVEQSLHGNSAGRRLDNLGNEQAFISSLSSSRVIDNGGLQISPGVTGTFGDRYADKTNTGYQY